VVGGIEVPSPKFPVFISKVREFAIETNDVRLLFPREAPPI